MSDAELNAKIKELQTELDSRHPKFDIQFKNPDSLLSDYTVHD